MNQLKFYLIKIINSSTKVLLCACLAISLTSCQKSKSDDSNNVDDFVLFDGTCEILSDTEQDNGDDLSGNASKSQGNQTDSHAGASDSSSKTKASVSTDNKNSTTSQSEEDFYMITDAGVSLKLNNTILERSIVSAGNQARIANVMKKASRGEPITIGVIGGSITYGVGASTSDTKYASLIKKWWKKNFESSKLTFVNAGLNATGSIIGVHRSPTDLLRHNPDLVVIDFSVNDGATDKAGQEGYESLVRRILKQENNPGVILLFLFDENGSTAQDLEREIGEHYDLPMLSYRDAIWPVGGKKVYQWSELSGDNIHPNDVGHAIIGEIFGHYLDKVKANMNNISTKIETLPSPVTANRYENSSILKPSDITPTSLGGFVKSGDVWTVKNKSDPIVFNLNSRVIHIMYKRTSNGTGGTVSVKINGKTVGQINSDFSGNYTYNAISQIVAGASSQNYTVELSLTSKSPKDSFTLLGILVSE